MQENTIPAAYDIKPGSIGYKALPAGAKKGNGRPSQHIDTLRRVELDARRMYSEYKYVTRQGTSLSCDGQTIIDIGAQYYKDHMGELHDLAAIEAYKEGVQIKVPVPITIGRRALSEHIESEVL